MVDIEVETHTLITYKLRGTPPEGWATREERKVSSGVEKMVVGGRVVIETPIVSGRKYIQVQPNKDKQCA